MPSSGNSRNIYPQDYIHNNNWPQIPQGFPPQFMDDRFNQPHPNMIPPFVGPQGNQQGQFRGPMWGGNTPPPAFHYNNYYQNYLNRYNAYNSGQGHSRWQHNNHRGNYHGQGGSRSQRRPHSFDIEDHEYKCCICKDHLQNSDERGIHLCDGGVQKKEEETIHFNVNHDEVDAKLESLLEELKGCLRNKYESVTQTLESYVCERIDEVSALHKDILEDKSLLQSMKAALEEKTALLETQEKELRAKEKLLQDDRKKLNTEMQEEKEEICRQWQQLRDEIARMEKLHEVQKGRIRLDIGGCQFTTSRLTLTRDSESMLAAMFSGRHPIKLEEDGTVFIDRDGTHFRYILNYLRDGGVQLDALPRNRQVLRELKSEAIFFQLHGLVQQIEKVV